MCMHLQALKQQLNDVATKDSMSQATIRQLEEALTEAVKLNQPTLKNSNLCTLSRYNNC